MGPNDYCHCHWQAAAFAWANLVSLGLLKWAVRTELVYFYAGVFQGFVYLRVEPCQCRGCWYRNLLDEVAEVRRGPFKHLGAMHESALDASFQLWRSAAKELYRLFDPEVLRRRLDFEFRRRASKEGLALKSDGMPSAEPDFVLHTMTLLEAAVNAVPLLGNELLGVVPAKSEEVSIEAIPLETLDMIREFAAYPSEAVTNQVVDRVIEYDLDELAAEVETELSRSVCLRCDGRSRKTRRETHLEWSRLRTERGMTYAQIARLYFPRHDGKDHTSTVAKAIARLRRRK